MCVDDDANLLQALVRQQRQHFDLVACASAGEALDKVRSEPFAVVVSDLRMPGVDGIELLKRVEQMSPYTTRIMLTGNADLATAKRAVNDGHIFRFLTKPCAPDELREAIRAGVRIHELAVAERDLLERTLRGAVEVLTETLSLVNPAAFGRANRVRRCVLEIAEQLGLEKSWQLEVAAMLSQIGCVTVPPAVAEKALSGAALESGEREMLAAHPSVGRQLIRGIPRLEDVAEIVGLQNVRFDGHAAPPGAPVGEVIPLGARLLKVALDLEDRQSRGASRAEAIERMSEVAGAYDPGVLRVLRGAPRKLREPVQREAFLKDLLPGMTIAENICSESGMLLVAAGQQVTSPLVQRLHNWVRSAAHQIREPIRVLVPAADEPLRDGP
jgi:response regulator RpfG family c-di-GMP phosphodiesterase